MTLAAPYGYLTHAGEEPYRFLAALGGAELLRLNDADAFGCLWWAAEPEGWAAPEAVTPMEDRSYGDGSYAGDTTYAARVLSWEGATVCPDRAALLAALARWRAVFVSRDPVLYVQDEPGGSRALWVHAVSQPKAAPFDGRGFTWTATMTADDPLKFDPAEPTAAVSTPLPSRPPGRTYSRAYRYAYGGGGASIGSVTATNRGDETAQAIYRMTGPVPAPRLVNVRTGQSAGWTITLGAADELVVDTATELVTLNGTPFYTSRVPGFVFPRILPGANEIRWSGDGTADPAARLYVSAVSNWK